MSTPAAGSGLSDGRLFFLFLTLALGLYANALKNGFVFDDDLTFRRNPAIRSLERLPETLTNYRPIRYLSFGLDYALSEDRPWAYHLLNSIYHGLTSFVVFLVLRRLLGGGAGALAGALLFLVHPVHTESVAYISGRRDVLTTLFFLLALLAYFRYRRTARRRWLAVGLACFGLALGAKEMAVTLPAVCCLHDFLFDRQAFRRHLPVYAGAFAVAAIAAAAAVFGDATTQRGFHGGSAAVNFLTVARLWVRYATVLVAPVTLLADYSYDAFPLARSWLEVRTLSALVLIALATAVALRYRRRAPLVTFGIAWFFITLLPVSHIVPFHELAAEHYLYLPSVGFCLLVGLGVTRLARRWGTRTVSAGFAVVLLAFAARTVMRNRDWRTSEALWRATVETAPRCARAHHNLATAYANGRDYQRAAMHYRRALEIEPDNVQARCQLARVYKDTGRLSEARVEFKHALPIALALDAAGRSPVAPGEICFALGRYGEGIRLFRADLAVQRRRRTAYRGLALCHQALGEHRAALDAWECLLALVPGDAKAREQAAALAEKLGDRERAARLRAPEGRVGSRGS
ncbi:MAG: tetratricopeptide repeat protein [Planctomycetota bacterium]|jgi:tetratricopeptide (TPR) repeat protein